MCIRFVYRGRDLITGFNFDIDPAQWDHRILQREDCFSIGILRPDGRRHCYHGVNRNGNVGTLLYVHGNPAGAYRAEEGCMTVADLTEAFVLGQLTWEGALEVLQTKRITYAPDATMQAFAGGTGIWISRGEGPVFAAGQRFAAGAGKHPAFCPAGR